MHTSEFLKHLHLRVLQSPLRLQILNSMSAKGAGRLFVITGSRDVPFNSQPHLLGDENPLVVEDLQRV